MLISSKIPCQFFNNCSSSYLAFSLNNISFLIKGANGATEETAFKNAPFKEYGVILALASTIRQIFGASNGSNSCLYVNLTFSA